MNYEGQICRPPMERASFMLPVAVGCSYNRCTFCTLFKHVGFRMLPVEQIEEELLRVRGLGGNPKKVFLGDGNAFGLPTGRLLEVIDRIRRYFPGCREINMDATVTNIREKSGEELRLLRESGVTNLYLGIESGLEDVLTFMKKDHTPGEAVQEIDRAVSFGFIYNAHIMTGIAGQGRGLENAEATARFMNRTKPARIVNFSLFCHREAPLWREIEKGAFIPAGEYECIQEERRLLERLEGFPLLYDGFHDSVEVRIRGRIPEDRERLLADLSAAAGKIREKSRTAPRVQKEKQEKG